MPDSPPAHSPERPSSRRLLRSTLIAAAVAILLLFTTVLPAEYGVDPTGVGEVLGLTEMGRIKVSLAKEQAAADSAEAALVQASATAEAASPAANPPAAPAIVGTPGAAPGGEAPPATNSHVTEVRLGPNEGKEIKLIMRKGAQVAFSWATDRGAVNYDLHADAPGISYHGYGKGNGLAAHEGTLVAAFDGSHGWFFRNRGSDALTVILRTNGDYSALK
ncbi:MAG: hypothetical protein KJZ47_06130 [Gemmatimonadales bacterium]|nr:hypothetical protein [Gemmatimonadales bacterium]